MITRRSLLVGTAGLALASTIGRSTMAAPTLWADTQNPDRPRAKDPHVIWFNDRYFLYYTKLPDSGDDRVNQGIATSTDLHNWKRVSKLPLFESGVCAGGAFVRGGKVHLFYQTYTKTAQDGICYASSSDGIHFNRDADVPIFRPTGSWNNGRAIDAFVIPVGTRLFCYYATRSPDGATQFLGVHSAPLDGPYTKGNWRQECSSPILKPSYTWEGKCIEAPSIMKVGSTYVMFYAGNFNAKPQQIGVAYSTDGRTWRKKSSSPFLRNGGAGSWNEDESGHPGIMKDQTGQTRLFYQGTKDGGHTYWIHNRRIAWDGYVPRLA